MYLNTLAWEHVLFSETRFWMAFVMGASMAVIMLGFMMSMYKDPKKKIAILAGSAMVFAVELWLVRSQQTIDDVDYMKSMIPHHSIAVMTSERAHIRDPRTRQLAREITDNSAPGNDREAQLDPPEPAAERAAAASLAQIAPGLLKPEPMTEADIASLSGAAGMCRFRYTEVGMPIFLYPASGTAGATIKLNGKLIQLPPAGGSAFADGGVRVEMNHPDGVPQDGQGEGS